MYVWRKVEQYFNYIDLGSGVDAINRSTQRNLLTFCKLLKQFKNKASYEYTSQRKETDKLESHCRLVDHFKHLSFYLTSL